MSIVIHVNDLSGESHQLTSNGNITLMQLLRDNDLGIQAVCGGNCACATCHVIIDPSSVKLIPKIEEEEEDLISILENATETSRLSCQIKLTDETNGLSLTVAPEED